MRTKYMDLLCICIAALLLLSSATMVVEAKKNFDKDGKDNGKGPKGISPGKNKHSDNQEPMVTIMAPTEAYAEGDSLVIVVYIQDEDAGAVPTILVDMIPTFNTGNAITVDIACWESSSEHLITAAYTDSGDKTGGDSFVVIKI